ncbi:MAG: hypothetical protein GEV07_08405 [Streptosporangiales bacterium]|nr:hypothetical protein [Streptosporangiales bacterium]
MSSTGSVSSPISATGEVGQLPPPDLASPGRRLVAFLVDILILTALTSPLLIPAGVARNQHRVALQLAANDPTAEPVAALPFWTSEWFVAVVLVVVFGLYRVPQVAGFGRTLGHRLLGLRVVMFTGRRKVGFGRALLRYLVFYGINAVPVVGPFFTFVNYLWCIFDKPYRQCLHDKVAGTFVLHPARASRAAQPQAR